MKTQSQKYEYDKTLSLFYTTDMHHKLLHYFKTDEEAKTFALKLIKSKGYKDYEILEERFFKNLPSLQSKLKLYEIRIVKKED